MFVEELRQGVAQVLWSGHRCVEQALLDIARQIEPLRHHRRAQGMKKRVITTVNILGGGQVP